MNRGHWFAFIACAACVSTASASNINIVLSAPPGPNADGTYNPGQVVTVTCALRSAVAATVPAVRFVQIDYSVNSPGLVNVDSDAVDPGFPSGTITNLPGSNLLTWDSGVVGNLIIPGSAGTPVVFSTFNVTMPATAGTSVIISVIGPVVDDGSLSGAHIENDTGNIWANGDADAVDNIAQGTIGLTTSLGSDVLPSTLHSTVAAHASSLVPSGAGVPAGTRFSSFERPFGSPNGTRWIMVTDTDNPTTTQDNVVMAGSGMSGVPVIREGMGSADIPVLAATQTLAATARIDINDSGHYVFRNATLPTATAGNVYIIKWDGLAFAQVARETEAYPGAPAPGVAGDTTDSCTINNAGTSGFFTIATGLPAATNDMGMFGSTIQFQQGFIPSGQIAPPAAPDTFSSTTFQNSEDGSDWLIQCSLPGATNDDMFVYSGAVIAQEGAVPAGASFTSNVASAGLGLALLMHNGDWFTRASNVDTRDWVMSNGVVLATTDDPITPGNTELFDDATFADCFFFMQGNSNGDYVVGGVTNRIDTNRDGVMVLNGTEIIARQGDAVDLDNNGLPDDNAYISTFGNDSGYLTDDMQLFFTVTMRNSAGTTIGEAFVHLDLTPCLADTDGNDAVDVLDLLAVINAWGACPPPCPPSCPADVAMPNNCAVDVLDLLAVINAWGPCP